MLIHFLELTAGIDANPPRVIGDKTATKFRQERERKSEGEEGSRGKMELLRSRVLAGDGDRELNGLRTRAK